MTAPARNQVIVRSAETPAVPYVHTTKIGQILLTDEARGQITALLPHGVELDRVLVEVHRATTKNADILNCTPASIIMAVGTAVQTGLVIGKTIHLVPVGKELQAWTDYKGDIELVIWSGAARHVDAQVVYANDHFEYEQGITPTIVHRPAIKNRGTMLGAYCIAYLNGTGTLRKIVWMPLEDIEKVRAKSRAWKNERECPDWYAMKTVIHRNCKTLPKTQRLAKVLALFDHQEEIDGGQATALDPSARIPERVSGTAEEIVDGEMEAAATESAPTPEAAELVVGSVEWARAYPLPFKNSEAHGTPMGSISTDGLESLASWIREKQKERGAEWHADTLLAIDLVMKDAAAQQTTLGLEDDDVPPVSTTSNPTTLAPGRLQDALDPPPAKAEKRPSLAEVSAAAAALLRDHKLTDDERAQFKKKYNAADTVEAMAALVHELETFLKVPF